MTFRPNNTVRRRFHAGNPVLYDGIFKDDWGMELMLLTGEQFPQHPDMGHTHWTYAGPPIREENLILPGIFTSGIRR